MAQYLGFRITAVYTIKQPQTLAFWRRRDGRGVDVCVVPRMTGVPNQCAIYPTYIDEFARVSVYS